MNVSSSAALAAAALGLLAVRGADAPAPALPDNEYSKVVESASGVIGAALKDKPDKRSADRARMAAIMIAAYAQQNLSGPDAAQRATVRDAALEVAALIKAKNYAQALKQAKELTTLKTSAQASKQKLKLVGTAADIDDVMTMFRQPPRGGLGIEGRFEEVQANAKGGVLAVRDLDEQLARWAYLTAVAAELTAEHVPEEKGKLKEWLAHAAEMRQQAITLGGAARAQDGKAAFRALELLNRSCQQCHKDFR